MGYRGIDMDYVVVLTHTQIRYDSRIRRQITMLSKNFNVILGCQRGSEEGIDELPSNITYLKFDVNTSYIGSALLKTAFSDDREAQDRMNAFGEAMKIDLRMLRLYEEYRADFTYLYKTLYYYVKNNSCKVKAIVVNDVALLPMGYRLYTALLAANPSMKLWGDMHEIHFNYTTDKESFAQKVRVWAADTYLPRCNYISSVSEWGAMQYRERYRSVPTITIRNVARYEELQPSRITSNLRLVHVGLAGKERQLEKMIDCMLRLDESYTLDFYLVASSEAQEKYIDELKQRTMELGLEERVVFHEAVHSERLIVELQAYDIGVFYLDPIVQNHVYALPNKLFEYIQARLAVVTTPLLSMKETIEEYQIGSVSKE